MRRFRIEFSIRELDVSDDQSQGIRFGDDVTIDKIIDFIDKCRGACRALFESETEVSRTEILKRQYREKINAAADEIMKKKYTASAPFYPGSSPAQGVTANTMVNVDEFERVFLRELNRCK